MLPLVLVLSACAPMATSSAPSTASTATAHATASATPTATTSQPAESAPAAAPGTALAALEALPVAPAASQDGYSRDKFGAAWSDVDRNGCDTRNDILARDLANLVHKTSCLIATGTLTSAYTGAVTNFVRGKSTSGEVQIDHVVALSDAWRTGAQNLTDAQRKALANDPLNLQAIEGPLNAEKSDQDASTWLPPLASYRCTYVARQVSVKTTYRLWVTPAERDAMANVLATCPDQPVLASGLPAN